MKKMFAICGLVAMAVCMALPAAAQEYRDYGFRPGDWELTLQGSGVSENDLDNSTLAADVSLAYFISEFIEVGIRQGISYQNRENADDLWAGSSRLFADYNFNLNRWKPFLGVNFGYLYGDSVNETFIAGPEAGLKYFVLPKTFIQLLVEYNFTFDSANEVDEAFDDGRFLYTLGIGFAW